MKFLAVVLSSSMLVACGGGGESSTPTNLTVTGTAAIGLPIAGAAVAAKCNVGTGTATTLPDGSYTLTVTGGQMPCILQITNPGIKLHSVAQSAGTTNITPLTDLITAILGGQDPAAWYDNAKSVDIIAGITANGLSTAQDKLKTVLSTLPGKPTLPTGFNPLTSKFSAQKGDAGDDLLEIYDSSLVAAGLTQTTAIIQIAAQQPLTQVAYSLKAFSPSKLTAVFAGSAKLQSGKTTMLVDDQHAEANTDVKGNITALVAGSPFADFVSLFGNTLGQLCMNGAGSNGPTMHSRYLFLSTDAGWSEVTDVAELFGKTFTQYEDCNVYYTTTFSATGDMTQTSSGGVIDDPVPVAIVRAIYSAQGFTKDANAGYAIAKAYKRTENGVTTYAYLFNGSDISEPRDYAILGVSQ